jgi:hypothetical protein
MPGRPKPTADNLSIATAARFVTLPRALSGRAVDELFTDVLYESAGRRVSKEIRVSHGSGDRRYIVSFLCFRTNPPIRFLDYDGLEETRYGFVLLVERRGYLVVFHQLAKGLDRPVTERSRPVDRRRVTHIWSAQARYQRFSTRRMTVSKQELRRASYEADDLETAFVPALAGRSILQTVGLSTRDYGTVGVTPSTGRVRRRSGKAGLEEVFAFIDSTLDGFEATGDSDFLDAFPSPVDVADLPSNVEPTGLLFDGAQLRGLLDDPGVTLEGESPSHLPDELLNTFSQVLSLRANGDEWEAVDEAGQVVARVKRMKHSFGVYSDLARGFVLRDVNGLDEPLDRWVREQDAFSLSFASPDYFYADGRLFRTGGFSREVALIRRFLKAEQTLDAARSEKGNPYPQNATRFAASSVFRILEDGLAATDTLLWCGDLGDEWADYVGVGDRTITFYHCKHGTPTTGASDLQVVIAQALKNLGRVKFRHDEIRTKLELSEARGFWSGTRIPLLARGPTGWPGLTVSCLEAAADPMTRWRVAVVITALSVTAFDAEAARAEVKPHFVQLVWLLSAFVSSCRERDAQPVVFCRP